MQRIEMKDQPQCPLCAQVHDTDNIKICLKHQEELLFSIDPEVELVESYCNN